MYEGAVIPDILSNEPKPEKKAKFEFNWINIASFIIFLSVCGWLLFHDPCEQCKVNNISCREIIQIYADYRNNFSNIGAAIHAGDDLFEQPNLIELINITV